MSKHLGTLPTRTSQAKEEVRFGPCRGHRGLSPHTGYLGPRAPPSEHLLVSRTLLPFSSPNLAKLEIQTKSYASLMFTSRRGLLPPYKA